MTHRSQRTPYEIRLELLQLAFDVLQRQHEANAASAHFIDNGTLYPTTSPTTEEIIAEANKLNSFISNSI